MPQMISDKHKEMHDILAISIASMKEGLEEDYRKHHSVLDGPCPADIANDFTDALAWYDRMLWTLHGIIMKESEQWRIDSLKIRLSHLETRLRKLEGRS